VTGDPKPEGECCGLGRPACWDKSDPKDKDSSLRQACQLCPDGPVYWDPTGEKKAAAAAAAG
jgi:hypothetical protein